MPTDATTLRRWTIRAVAAVAFTGAAVYAGLTHAGLIAVAQDLHYNDFGKFYYGLQNWTAGASLYGRNPATFIPFTESTGRQFWNMNPPHFHFFIWPLLFFEIGWAFYIWTVANIAAFVLALIAIVRAAKVTLSPGAWMLVALALFWGAPTIAWSVTGQMTGLIVALVTLIWLDVRSGRWLRAGIAIGLAVSIKLFFGPLAIFLLLKRQWRAVYAGAATGLLLLVAGVAVFGVQSYLEWISALRDVTWVWAVMNGSIFAPVARLWLTDESAFGFTPDLEGAMRIGWLLALPILVIGLVTAWRSSNPDKSVLVVILTSLLASPLGWVYYYWIALGPFAVLRQQAGVRRTALLAAVWLVFPYYWLWPNDSMVFALTLGSAYTWSLLTAWTGSVLLREPRDQH